jgi:hypothetical protein
MGVFTRPDSPWWWLYLETTREKERTDIKVGTTVAQRHDSRKLADDRYHQRMNELAARLYKLPSAQPAIRFAKYADAYAINTIPHHKGAGRELEMLKALRGFFGDDLLTAIDQDRVKAYHTHRRPTCVARTINREVDLLKAMLRDAVPKYLTASPLVGMKRLRTVKPKRRLMTPSEDQKLLAVGDAVDRALLILAGRDGLIRLGDLLDLQRTDRARGWLYVADPKSGEPYEVALTERAAKALDATPRAGPYYFAKFRKAENPRDWPGSVRQRLERLCARAGVPYGKKAGGLTFHWATRRTGAHRLVVQEKKSIPAVQRQGNWKTPDVLLSIYAEADRDDQRKAFPPRSRSKRKRA